MWLVIVAIVATALLVARTASRRLDEERAATTAATVKAEAAGRARDAALDALAGLTDALDNGHAVDGALANAHWVLHGHDYTGRLRGTQNALDEALQDLDDLRAYAEARGVDLVAYATHAAAVRAALTTEADTVHPAPALHTITARTSRSTTC